MSIPLSVRIIVVVYHSEDPNPPTDMFAYSFAKSEHVKQAGLATLSTSSKGMCIVIPLLKVMKSSFMLSF